MVIEGISNLGLSEENRLALELEVHPGGFFLRWMFFGVHGKLRKS